MNWLNDMIINLQNKILSDSENMGDEQSGISRRSEKESRERLHQFQSRLADLDKRILELR